MNAVEIKNLTKNYKDFTLDNVRLYLAQRVYYGTCWRKRSGEIYRNQAYFRNDTQGRRRNKAVRKRQFP